MPVYKQPNSPNWLIEFTIERRRYRRSSGTNIKRRAQRIEEKWRHEIHAGNHGIGVSEPLTLGEAVNRYLESVIQPTHSRANSKKAEGYALKVIVRAFGAETRIERSKLLILPNGVISRSGRVVLPVRSIGTSHPFGPF